MEQAGCLPQIGEPAKEVKRVSQETLAGMSNRRRETVTKNVSLFAAPDPNWTPARRQARSQKMRAICHDHPHWQGQAQPKRATERKEDPTPSLSRDAGHGRRQHVACILTRNAGFAVANSYALAMPDAERPGLNTGFEHAAVMQEYFGKELYAHNPRLGGILFRKALGWLWHENMPNYPTCVCRLGQRKFDFQHVCPKCGGKGFRVESPALGDGPGSGMPVNCKVFIQFLHILGIDTEFRFCRAHQKTFAGGQSCPVCHSEGAVTKPRGILKGWTQVDVGKVLGQSVSTIAKWEKVCERANLMRTILGRAWRLCTRCNVNYSGSRCKCGFTGGEVKRRDAHKYLWLVSRTMDSDLVAGERERLDAALRRWKRSMDAQVMHQLQQAVELALKVLGEWSGGEHRLESFWNEMRRRLAHSGSLSCFANVLFPLDTS